MSMSARTIKHTECDIDCSVTFDFIQCFCPNVVNVLCAKCSVL